MATKHIQDRKKDERQLVDATETTGVVIKYTYRPNWKEAPVYECPELTYRGKV